MQIPDFLEQKPHELIKKAIEAATDNDKTTFSLIKENKSNKSNDTQ